MPLLQQGGLKERMEQNNQPNEYEGDALEDAIDEPCIYDEFGFFVEADDDSDFYQEMMDLNSIRKGEARA